MLKPGDKVVWVSRLSTWPYVLLTEAEVVRVARRVQIWIPVERRRTWVRASSLQLSKT